MQHLGKLAPRFDNRTLKLSSYIKRVALPPLPQSTDYRSKVTGWGPMLNTQIGDCAIAGPGHMIQCWTANVGKMYVPPDADILAAYSAVSGYDPKTGQNDNGCVMLDVMNYWRKTGISGHKIGAFAALHLKDHGQVMEAVSLFDGCAIGLNLPRAWQSATDWQAPQHPIGPWQPGSWGGHMVPILDFDATWLYILTWGEVKRMSWYAYDTYCDESYVVFSADWFNAENKAPNGFDWNALADDLNQLAGVNPGPSPNPNPVPGPAGHITLDIDWINHKANILEVS